MSTKATIKSYVPQAIKAVQKGTIAGMITIANNVTNQAKALSPVDTGELRSSLMWKAVTSTGGHESGPVLSERPKADQVIVGTATEYGVYQEYGTRKMDAQPFLRPAIAIETNGTAPKKAMADAMNDSCRVVLKRENG